MAIYKRSTYLFASAACLGMALAVAASIAAASSATSNKDNQLESQKKQNNVNEEMQLIRKSLDDLIAELNIMKREATSRLANFKNQVNVGTNSADSSAQLTNEQLDRIRQTKVSRFVLKRVAELESESLKMRDEMISLLATSSSSLNKADSIMSARSALPQTRQEDYDFDAPMPSSAKPTTTTTTTAAATSQSPTTSTSTTTTMKPEEEAAKIGFDLEALKKLAAELESEIEARQAQNPNSLRGVHEQVIRLVDNMVQNYLGNMRRAIQRMNNFIAGNRSFVTQLPSTPRQSPAVDSDQTSSYSTLSKSVVDQLQDLAAKFSEFPFQWARVVGKQQSPLLDRIPPRGVELWRDFWDTVRKQVRRINEEFWQLSRDMSRMVTGGRLPPTGPNGAGHPALDPNRQLNNRTSMGLLYRAASSDSLSNEAEQLMKQFQEFYDKLSVTIGEEQKKMDALEQGVKNKVAAAPPNNGNYFIDENDDEQTRNELTRNVALRQQIQQEINVFGSIFDIMREFISRLRDSASSIRDILQPGAINTNDPVTPGPSVKPTVDQVLQDTINGQRQINSQAKPVLVAQKRPSMANNGRR